MRKVHVLFSGLLNGMPILALPIGIYLFIGRFIAGIVVDFTQGILLGTWYYNIITGYLFAFMDRDNFIPFLIIGEYGLLTMVPIYLLGLLLPLVASFYFVLFLLNDSGLLHRISLSSRRFFRFMGLSGEGVIPMMLGFGCVTAALISVNTLKHKREQLIASILLCIAIPCSAQFAIILGVASILPFKYMLIYILTIASVFVAAGLLLNQIVPGKFIDCAPETKPLRIPAILPALAGTFTASREFLKDSAPTFALGSLFMSVLNYSGWFAAIHKWCEPVTSGLLGLPPRATDLFMLAIIKKDLGAAEFYTAVSGGAFSHIQITVTLVVMTLFVPCFASFMVLFKDRGAIIALVTWLGSFLLSFALGGLVSEILNFLA
ncbi:hypothetical protein MASR2M70_03900 [Bacillota bacterium]